MAQTKLRLGQIETITRDVELINTITLGSNGTVIFSGIPQTYTHLWIVGRAKSVRTDGTDNCSVRFNGDSGANYWDCFVVGYDNGTVNGSGARGANRVRAAHIPGSESGYANSFGAVDITIPNYTSNKWKAVAAKPGGAYNASVDVCLALAQAGWWLSTAAITTITLLPNAVTQLAAGTTLSLYGIRG
jgi:hypothetical protein